MCLRTLPINIDCHTVIGTNYVVIVNSANQLVQIQKLKYKVNP